MTTRAVSNKEGKMGDGGTVKVRVCVAVDGDGVWNACGWSVGAGMVNDGQELPRDAREAGPDGEMAEAASEHVRTGERVFYLTAELPIPVTAPQEVAAGVEVDG